MRATTFAPIAAAVAAILLVTGCSSTSDGQPNAEGESGGSATVAAQDAAPGEMDPGTFRTTPQPAFGKVTSVNSGRYVEGQRMAEFVVLPSELDPLLVGSVPMSTYVIKSGKALSILLTGKSPDIAEREGMLTGFSTSRKYEDKVADKSIVHAVLRFPDAASAKRAAVDMSADDALPGEYSDGGVPTPIDILPDTLTTTREASDGSFSSNSFTPHGQYIIYTWASAPIAEKAWTAQVTAKALAQQAPMIDKFPATPADKFAELPMDIDNVLVLTVPEEDGNKTTSSSAVYGPRGAAHFSSNPTLTIEFMSESKTTLNAVAGTGVYRSETEQGASTLFDLFSSDITNQGFTKSANPPGIPNTACFTKDTPRGTYNYCIVHQGRYLGEISVLDDEKKVHQMTTAQYQILATQ
ncbi:hypothetical protein [Rhodococcus sp. ARC_M6]|uniref:DUF7373 family lipoprotein n=1 Tax=Rhodococcus sp. ARC_M6 TaxID=2928852 RepID=UPI001FB2AB35|nr:hypothetical protein [Rhodococcus sp. ARC_M6]MCJ0907110.1 hypothetical protein [Rhodococcus sp. ARC_M6]